jgi:anti-sigma regulatory factor (Ser/Thr protein kinase)
VSTSRVAGSSREFEPDTSSVRAARQFVVGSPEVEGADTSLLELAVSELASNAVLHARTPFVVTVERLDDGVRVSVADGDPSPPRVRHVGADAITGRGLAIVEAVSRRMEVAASDGGKTVRFEIGWATP